MDAVLTREAAIVGTPMPPVPPDFIVQRLMWFHGQYPFVGLLLLMMMLDVLTGLTAAFIAKKLSSAASWNGMGKKVLILAAVGMGTAMEPYAAGLPLGRLVAVFYTVTEGLSILENLSRAGVPIPQQLRDALEKLSAEKDVGRKGDGGKASAEKQQGYDASK